MSHYFWKCPHFFKGGGTLSPTLKFLGRTLNELTYLDFDLCVKHGYVVLMKGSQKLVVVMEASLRSVVVAD